MKLLITGSSGHLGEALVRSAAEAGHEVTGVDLNTSPYTDAAGSITDRSFVHDVVAGVDGILHAATLHKPHVATHPRQDFIDTNITGTLNLLEEAVAAEVGAFVFTSTTSTFGDAMRARPGQPAVWVTEDLVPQPKNIYGVTKLAAENLCQMFQRNFKLPCLVLRTSRFFPEEDDDQAKRDGFEQVNLKVNELLFRRADIQDMVSAHFAALDKAPEIGFDRLIISATTPFKRADSQELARAAPVVVEKYCPDYVAEFERRGWRMLPTIERVYDNSRALKRLDWKPRYSFAQAVAQLIEKREFRSPLAVAVGSKGYHDRSFAQGPFPVEDNP